MAGPKPTSYEPELQKLASPASNSNTSLSPGSGGGTPISFKPNVNRAKTKRWVEARSYSYDGNDWGDDDDDEYDEEPPPPVPQPHKTPANTTGLPRPSFPGDRSRSMDQVLTVEPDGASGRSRSADDDPSSNRPAPFVRPADIYKRMREDRAKAGLPSATRSNTDPTASPLGQETTDSQRGPTTSNLPSATPRDPPPIIKLPEVKRSSGIGTDFIGGTQSGNTQDTQTQSAEEPHRLQHNPSLGFRSAVNQAFDVPETPSSTVESVGRSNSDSTSVSPIMPSRGQNNDEKTPTIAEEPGDVTPRDVDRNIIFKPGHRRDLSLPSPDNSPSRKPQIMNNEEAPPSAIAQLSSTTLPDSSKDQPLAPLQQPKRASVQLPSAPGKDLPAPLRVSSTQNLLAGSNEAPAAVLPSLSADNSPQDTESDRLRKEIIRSLSRENTPSEQGSRPQTGHEGGTINKYESYWSEELTQSPQEQPNPSMPEHNPQDISSPNDAPPAVGLDPAPWQDSQPKLKRRFSWESSSSEEPEAVTNTYSQDPPIPGQLPPDNDTVPPIAVQDEAAHQPATEKPKLTIIPPSAGDENSIISGQHLPEVVYPPPADPHQPPVPTSNALVPIPKSMLGFRDILGIRSSDERVRAFDRTREQFGSLDTGLTHWMQVTLEAHPEHGDIVGQNMKLSAGASKALGRSKFPKLPSLGNFGASNSQGAPPGHGHVRRTSAPLGSMKVEQRGKDFLHTAGNLGGRAGEAAKGFFARGRSKFKGSGNEKGSQSMRISRNAFQLSKIPGLSAMGKHGSGGKSNQRHSVHLGGLSQARSSLDGGRRSLPGSRHANTDPRDASSTQDAEATGSTNADKGLSVQRPQSVPPGLLRSPWVNEEPEQQSDSHQGGANDAQDPTIKRKCVDWASSSSQGPPDAFLAARPSHKPAVSSVSSLGTQDVRQTDNDNQPNQGATVSRFSLPTEPSNHVHFPTNDAAPQRGGQLARVKTNTTKTRAPSPYPSAQPSESEVEGDTESTASGKKAVVDEPAPKNKGKAPMRQRILQSASAGQKNALGKISEILQTNKEKIQRAQPRRRNNNTNKADKTTNTTSKEKTKEKEKAKEMPTPKPNNIPYSPNDYWDRTRFSDPDKSPSHSIASLPHHPPALSITSTSPSRNNEIPPPSSRGRSSSSQRTYAQELQLRSRSPKLFELRPRDKAENGGGGRDPANQLGGFRAVNPRTSRVGDQELPWKLSIPGDSAANSPATDHPPAAVADASTVNADDKHPRGPIRTINEGQPPVELPSDKDKEKEKDEGEEIVMSSTAYPGQEWRPDGLSQWEYW